MWGERRKTDDVCSQGETIVGLGVAEAEAYQQACFVRGWLLFVDFSKAYDYIDHEALLLIMKAHRFHPSSVTDLSALRS